MSLASGLEEWERHLKRSEQKWRSEEKAADLRHTLERMDQTNDAQGLVRGLVRMI